MSERNFRKKGITLLEMLLAVSILSMVMASLSFSLFQSSTFRDKANELIVHRQKQRIMFNLIRFDLRSAIYMKKHAERIKSDKGETGIVGLNEKEGERDINQIYLHVHAPSRLVYSYNKVVDPEVHEISYFLIRNDEDEYFSLYRSEKFYIRMEFEKITEQNISTILGDNITRKSLLLSDRVAYFRVRYLKGLKASGEQNWLNTWETPKINTSDPEKLPEAIQVEIGQVFEEGGEVIEDSFVTNLRPNLGKSVEWEI